MSVGRPAAMLFQVLPFGSMRIGEKERGAFINNDN
jgi:hypothetical protein